MNVARKEISERFPSLATTILLFHKNIFLELQNQILSCIIKHVLCRLTISTEHIIKKWKV